MALMEMAVNIVCREKREFNYWVELTFPYYFPTSRLQSIYKYLILSTFTKSYCVAYFKGLARETALESRLDSNYRLATMPKTICGKKETTRPNLKHYLVTQQIKVFEEGVAGGTVTSQ